MFRGTDLGKHYGAGNEERSRRRLETQERHGRRMEGLEQCRKRCDASDKECNCGVLSDCVGDLSDYDMAALALYGFLVTDEDDQNYGGTSSDVDLFLAASNFYKDTILPIRELAHKGDCKGLLSRFVAPCDPQNPYCNTPNTQVSFVGLRRFLVFDCTKLLTLDPPRLDVSKLD